LGLPNTYGDSEHLVLDAGFYLFRDGAAIAVVSSLIMVVTSVVRLRPMPDAPLPHVATS
jgi:hypothetical protein